MVEVMTHSGGKPHTNIGDRGQRWEIRGIVRGTGVEEVFGWTSEPGGGTMLESANLWPRYEKAWAVDRQ